MVSNLLLHYYSICKNPKKIIYPKKDDFINPIKELKDLEYCNFGHGRW